MASLEQIKGFRTWAISLGYLPSDLANEDVFKSNRCVFKSRQSQLFTQLQSRIQPRQHVQAIRENILIAKVNQHKDKVVTVCERSFLPKEQQTFLKMQELQRKKQAAEEGLADAKKEYEVLAGAIKSNNIQTISAKHKKNILASKYNLLWFKLESLNKTYGKELLNKANIQAILRLKLNATNAGEKLAGKAVEEALKKLEIFYNVCNNANGDSGLIEAKQNLWSEMRSIFANTPNFLIFNSIMKMKEEQLQHIMQLNTQPHLASVHVKQPLSKFEIKLLKTKADLLGLVAKYVCAQDEVMQLEERFSLAYIPFVNELQKRVNNLNAITEEDSTEEIISDFIVQYNMRNFNRARNDFLTEQIEHLRQELDTGSEQLKDHDMLLSSVKQVYGEINDSINRIQQEMLQLPQIKEKILYSKNMMRNMLNEMQVATQNINAKTHLLNAKLKVNNVSLLGMESFNPANESVFSSTKLDFDANRSANATLMPYVSSSSMLTATVGSDPTLPCHLIELNTFDETPLEKLSCVPQLCSFLLSANPLIVESQELASTVLLAPGILLTPFGALQEVRKRILWASAIAEHSSEFKLNLGAIIVNPHDLKLKAKCQNEEIIQLLDSIESICSKAQHQLQMAERIYRFLIDNPLRKYVPTKKRFNNATYSEYENEFNLYYRIATAGASIK